MRHHLFPARFPRHRAEDGFALAAVMVSSTVLTLLAAAIVAYGIGSQNISRHDQDWNGALSAAEAGIDDYLFRLNENANYWQFSQTNLPTDGNHAFAAWEDVSGGNTNSQFHYKAETSTMGTDGRIRLTSTGRINKTMRTVSVTVRRRSFLDYLYFTDMETVDPALYNPPQGCSGSNGSCFTSTQAQTSCSALPPAARYYYGGAGVQRDEPNRSDFTNDSDNNGQYCDDPSFISADTINGPMHTNDAFMLCGTPHFNGATSTSWTGASGQRWRDNCPTSHPVFANAGDPQLLAPLLMPPSNLSIKPETALGKGGCLYTGPTRIILNSNGTMTVKSPFSRQTNNNLCPLNGQSAALPSNGVIFVQNVPATVSDPNYTKACKSHPLGMPIANDITTYGCSYGDAFIEGTLKGQLTVATDNSIVETWHLQYANGVNGNDLLGLVANNFVEIYHPVQCTSGTSSSCNLNASFPGETARNAPFSDPYVYAAELSVLHSVREQNWGIGAPLGALHVRGALAQRYRGPVGMNQSGTIVNGFSKDYVYDQRLHYLSPPKFLNPVTSQWGQNTWAEVKTPSGLPS